MNPVLRTYYWLSHYLFSNTLHGTHSPFVYSFLEKVIYQKTAQFPKSVGLLHRIAKFTPNNLVYCINADESSLKAISCLNKTIINTYEQLQDETLGLVYFGEQLHAAEIIDTYHQLKNKISIETVFVFSNLLDSNTKTKVWRHLCKDEKNIISIDLLHTGIMFFDSKKLKEHFRIYY